MYRFLPILLFAFGMAITTDDIYDNSYALIIGIDKYENVSNLDYAVKDANSVASLLKDNFNFPSENVKILLNDEATLINVKNSLEEISLSAKVNDRVLIYFAGHGETDDLPDGGEMGYLLPIDGKRDRLFSTSVPMDDLKRISSMSKSKHMLFLIDACYGGLAATGARGLSSTTPNYIDKITKDKSRQIITAGGRGEKVIEKSEWGHSAFTLNLIRALEDGKADLNEDGFITGDELGLFLKEKVTIDSENQQTPQSRRFTSHEGEFIFITNIFIENQNIDKDNIIISGISYDSLANILVQKFDKKKSPVSKQSHIKKLLPHISLSPQLTRLWGNDMLDKYGESRLSFSGGGNYWYYFSENFALSAGIWFEKKRGATRIGDLSNGMGNVTEYDYDYITLPILGKKYIFKNKRYFTEVGIYYSYLLKTTAQSGGEDLTQAFHDGWEKNDYGVIYGIGNDLMINENIIIALILRRQLGLQNISSVNVYNDQSIQHSSVGLVFCIGLPKL